MVSLELLTCKVYQSSLNLLTKQLVANMAGLTMWGLAQITFLNPPILSFISHDHFLSIVLSYSGGTKQSFPSLRVRGVLADYTDTSV